MLETRENTLCSPFRANAHNSSFTMEWFRWIGYSDANCGPISNIYIYIYICEICQQLPWCLIVVLVRQQITGRCIEVRTKFFFLCSGYFSMYMYVGRIQLMPLCHHWGIVFIDKKKQNGRHAKYETVTGMILVAVLLFLSFMNSIRRICMLLTWFSYVETIFNFKMAVIQC